MEKYIKFVMLHYEDYLDAMLGKYGDDVTNQLWKLRDNLRKEIPEWRKNALLKAEIDSKLLIKYLEIFNINLNIDED